MCKVLGPISSMGRAETGKDIDWEQRQKSKHGVENQEQQSSGRTGCESLGEGPASTVARGERGVPTLSEHGGQGLPGLVRNLELPILGKKKTLKEHC